MRFNILITQFITVLIHIKPGGGLTDDTQNINSKHTDTISQCQAAK